MCLLGFITYLLVTEVSRENVGQRATLLNLNVTLINSGPRPPPPRKGVQLKYTHTRTHTRTHTHTHIRAHTPSVMISSGESFQHAAGTRTINVTMTASFPSSVARSLQ